MATLLTEPRTTPTVREAPPAPPRPAEKPPRLVSLDAYRGFVMLLMASGGLGIAAVADKFPKGTEAKAVWDFLAFHVDHVKWVGCSFWDMIQPSFMFMVGVALPYSYASRRAQGASYPWMLVHALWRSLVLIALGIFLSSTSGPITNFTFVNVLTQIGLGYFFLFLLVNRGAVIQGLTVVAILAIYTWFFTTVAPPVPGYNHDTYGLPADWHDLEGWSAYWNKSTNAAAMVDRDFLSWFPRANKDLKPNSGGYQTLNFIPSLATMILGLMAGEWLRRPASRGKQFFGLAMAGVVCLALGLAMGQWVPIVKRIWTPSWTLYSAGWTLLMLAAFYGVIDGVGWRWWAFPLVVVGMNSIAMYVMAQLWRGFIADNLKFHLRSISWEGDSGRTNLATYLFEGLYGPIVLWSLVLFVLWLITLWMYRRKIFLKI